MSAKWRCRNFQFSSPHRNIRLNTVLHKSKVLQVRGYSTWGEHIHKKDIQEVRKTVSHSLHHSPHPPKHWQLIARHPPHGGRRVK